MLRMEFRIFKEAQEETYAIISCCGSETVPKRKKKKRATFRISNRILFDDQMFVY